MTVKRKLRQKVTVELSSWDSGLQELLCRAAGAPRRADLTFHERGVSISWSRSRKAPDET